jgi:hypothetical protein
MVLENMRFNVTQHGCMLALALPFAISLLIAGPVDWGLRYQSWSQLSKDTLIQSANSYIANRAPGNGACLFAVECKSGWARLKLVKSMKDWDFEASKQIAWDRKFDDICQGLTANFALELANDNPQSQKTYEGSRRAVWSFYNDQFVPTRTRFGFAAFSEAETEPCVTSYSVTTPWSSKPNR